MSAFRVVVADPPWAFADALPGPKRGAAKHYATMSVDQIAHFELPPIADDAWLFLWRVSSQVEEALAVVRAWGFVPKAEIVWVKLTANARPAFGMGHYVRGAHETCIVATRGHVKAASRSVRSVFFSPRLRHSEKPEVFFELVEEIAGRGPFVELFARRRRSGWAAFGDELPAAAE